MSLLLFVKLSEAGYLQTLGIKLKYEEKKKEAIWSYKKEHIDV